ncbi:hypothetical protein CS542_05880 [Pedobacter sp. IW39]|nr:hypothetical protein CS542_05880 [Pedobacter sp. IW39]
MLCLENEFHYKISGLKSQTWKSMLNSGNHHVQILDNSLWPETALVNMEESTLGSLQQALNEWNIYPRKNMSRRPEKSEIALFTKMSRIVI